MSTQYTTEPPATATVLIHTTAGPLTISLFAQQTPLTCRNFLQLCLDGYYDNCIFHRVSPGFVIQTGDPTGTGEGGQNIYEDREFETLDADWAKLLRTDEGEKINFGDELHSRLKFNRRGLVGMAKGTGEGGGYGSQFFVTLGDCRAQLDGTCTMFGRVEGDGIYNVVKIAEGDLIEGTERPMYPEKILRVEIVDLPKSEPWQKLKKRERVATRTVVTSPVTKKKPQKKKVGRALLSFAGDEGDEDGVAIVKPKKAKFNTSLIDGPTESKTSPPNNGVLDSLKTKSKQDQPQQIQRSPSPSSILQKRKAEQEVHTRSPESKRRKPSFHDSTTQLPLRNPESPSRSPTPIMAPAAPKSASSLQAEIAALKASMHRDTGSAVDTHKKPKSALEAMIPATSTRGRKRPRAGEGGKESKGSLALLDAFKARLEGAVSSDSKPKLKTKSALSEKSLYVTNDRHDDTPMGGATIGRDQNKDEDAEALLCDLHFIANCQSCFSAMDRDDRAGGDGLEEDTDDRSFLTHSLTFEKDRLGKDLNWKKKNEEELVVIDPRERERELGIKPQKGKGRGKERGSDGGGGGGGGGVMRDWDRNKEDKNRGTGRVKDRDRNGDRDRR